MDDLGPIERAIRQHRPFATASQRATVGLMLVADRIRRRLETALEPHGVTPQQYNVLRILRGAGAEGLPTMEIAERMIERTPGITRLLDRLERKGLTARRRGDGDRRQVWCTLEPAGERLLDRVGDLVDAAEAEALAPLAGADLDRLTLQLGELVARRIGG
jgi:DNA-binding MarR family transcriptional regulator